MAEDSSELARFIALSARELTDRQVCFVGIGIPSLAAMAAKRCHAPGLVLAYESGAVDSIPPVPPLSTGSPAVVANTAMITSCLGVFSMLQQGYFDLGMLSAAQVDRFGNLNSTVLGDYAHPKVRLVGSGGAHDIALLAREIVILMPHDPRRFVREVDFITSPGRRRGSEPGYTGHGQGPRCVLTPRARFSFELGELTLDALAEGVTEDEAVEGFGWTVPRSPQLGRLPPPESDLARVSAELAALSGREAT